MFIYEINFFPSKIYNINTIMNYSDHLNCDGYAEEAHTSVSQTVWDPDFVLTWLYTDSTEPGHINKLTAE